jgi:hypothetical protein
MSGRRDIDPVTADSEEEADFAEEHTRPTYREEPATEQSDESVPSGRGGDGGMDVDQPQKPV